MVGSATRKINLKEFKHLQLVITVLDGSSSPVHLFPRNRYASRRSRRNLGQRSSGALIGIDFQIEQAPMQKAKVLLACRDTVSAGSYV